MNCSTDRRPITSHARMRLRQRGVPLPVLDLLLGHGDTTLHAGEGCETIALSQDAARALVGDGFNPDDVAKATRLAAVLGKRGVVTVLRPVPGPRGRCYRRQMPTRSVRSRRR